MTSDRENITYGELGRRVDALVAEIEKTASKSALVLMVAHQAVMDGWLSTLTRAGIDEAEQQLMARIEGWLKSGRMHNQTRRTENLLTKLQENNDARAAGRRAPHTFKAPRRRRKRRTTK